MRPRRWILAAVVVVLLAGVSGLAAGTNTLAVAGCTASPTTVTVGEDVTLDASNSDASYVKFDVDGDDNYERTDETDFVITTTYSEPGTYDPVIRAQGDPTDTDPCGTITVESPNDPPTVELSVSPNPTTVGQSITFEAFVFDADGTVKEYAWDVDGDGTPEGTTSSSTFDYSYASAGNYVATVTVTDDDGATGSTSRDVVVAQEENSRPSASISVSPRPGQVGSPSFFDASASSDSDGLIGEYRWDFDGDGTVDKTTTGPTTSYPYRGAGNYVPTLEVVDDDGATALAETDYTVESPSIQAACTLEPTTVAPGGRVFIDARGSENAQYVDYDPDGDGEYEVLERTNFTYEAKYNESGTYTPLVRAHGGGETAIDECPTVVVEGENQPPIAAFTVDPQGPTTEDRVVFNGSNSRDPDGTISTYHWDFQGDGTVDLVTGRPVAVHTYAGNGSYVPTLEVRDDDNASGRTSRDLFVERGGPRTEPEPEPAPDEDEGLPLIPIGIGGAGILGLGGLWYLFGPGGGGGTTGGNTAPKPKPKPRPADGKSLQYETGVFALPSTSDRISVPVDFDPDLLLFSTTNGARTDPATDRTAGWSRGIVHAGKDKIGHRSVTVADDAHHTDQATCATDDAHAFQVIRHQPEAAPGRVQAAVAGTSGDGFDLDVSIPGDDPLAGGIRVSYQAIQFPSGVSLDVDHFRTPTEPGTQTVDLGLGADHVSLLASDAVTGAGRLWTTDRGLGLAVGQAVDDEGVLSQTTYGSSVWPRAGHDSAAVSREDRSLHLLYQDADRLAGRTSATVGALGETLRLQYDRVYNGPHKLGSTARHVVPYLALDGGETARPAVGATSLPAAGESISIDCGFEPAMIEITVSGAPLGEEVGSGATAQPFGWSFGTVITDEDRLRQYVIHHALVPDLPDASVEAADAAGRTTGATGGAAGTGGADTDHAATDGGLGAGPTARDSVAAPSATESPDSDVMTAPKPPENPDDELVGIHLRQGADGAIVGRESVRVRGMTEGGFDLAVRGINVADGGKDRDGAGAAGDRPAVHYRAWPAADATRTETTAGSVGHGTAGQREQRQGDSEP